MSDFEAARKRLEEAPPWHAEDVRLLLEEIKAGNEEYRFMREQLTVRAEKAEAEVERLEEELRSWHEGDNECCKMRHEAQIAREEALAEVERLKGELIKNRHDTATCVWMQQAARDLKRAEKAEAELTQWQEIVSKHEAEVERLRAECKAAFVSGAAWWEFESRGGTIWQSDRRRAEAEADRRWPGVPWPALRGEGEK